MSTPVQSESPCRHPRRDVCLIDRIGCGCDGAVDVGCGSGTPDSVQRPACPYGFEKPSESAE